MSSGESVTLPRCLNSAFVETIVTLAYDDESSVPDKVREDVKQLVLEGKVAAPEEY